MNRHRHMLFPASYNRDQFTPEQEAAMDAGQAAAENEPRTSLVGTRWRDARRGIATVERIEDGIVYGRWAGGKPWAEAVSFLAKYYVEVDGGPTDTPPSTALRGPGGES